MLKRIILTLAALSVIGCSACSPQEAPAAQSESGTSETDQTSGPDTAQVLPPQITLKMLTDAQAQTGEPAITYRDEPLPQYIDSISGSFLSDPVRNEQDAGTAVASLAELLQIPDFYNEIRYEGHENDGTSDIYSFRQYYSGIPVCNAQLLLFADPVTGRTQLFQNGYQPGLTLSTKSEYPASDAAKAARKALSRKDLAEPVLVIWLAAHAEAHLAWNITEAKTPCTVFVADAMTGSALFEDQIVSD